MQHRVPHGVDGHGRKAREVHGGGGARSEAAQRIDGMPKRVGDAHEAPTVEDHGPRVELPQPQRGVVEQLARGAVAGEIDLESAVETEAVHHVGAHAPTHGVGSLEERPLRAARLERVRTCEPCKTSADDRRPGHGAQF